MPIGAAGFTPVRSTQYLDSMIAEFETASGLIVDRNADNILYQLFVAVAAVLGDASSGLQEVYDAIDINNATGVVLDAIGLMVGITRNAATFSTATVTFSGTNGTIIPIGSIVEGGGPEDTTRWATTAAGTIASGSVDILVQASDSGAITAGIGDIDKIVTARSGLASVTNAAAATAGTATESDTDYRTRILTSLFARGSSSAASLKARLLELDFVTTAIVTENDTGSSAVIGGITVPAHAVNVVIAPAGSTLTTAQKTSLVTVIYEAVPIGIQVDGSDNTATVTGADGLTKTIPWDDVSDVTVTVAITLTLDTGFVLADVQDAVEDAVEAHFAALDDAEPLSDSDLIAGIPSDSDVNGIMAIAGISRASVTLDIGAGATTLITPNRNQRLVLEPFSGSSTVTT